VLSILIPIYNTSATSLVKSLLDSANELALPVEILCFDDASTEFVEENSKLASYSKINYQRMPKNLGRSGIRNLLAANAQFDMLLLIDGDMSLTDIGFLPRYKEHILHKHLCFGGLVYRNEEPTADQLLRWTYGHQREALPAEARKKKNYLSTKTCNLLISKEIFLQIGFNQELKQYGHEDTLFSFELERHAVHVNHIDNPLIHDGLESAELYLHKVRLAAENLALLKKNYLSEAELNEFNLIRIYERLNGLFLLEPMIMFIKLMMPMIERNLKSNRPIMWYLDLYKAYYFHLYSKA
jgi:glycosyltransferase involved in cell wall biosynthesis